MHEQQAHQAQNTDRAETTHHFANPDVVVAGWYPVAKTANLRRGKKQRVAIGRNTFLLHRDRCGSLRATQSHCGHLGADLIHGKVTPQGLRCAFHGWCWAEDGTCNRGPGKTTGRTINVLPVEERWGLAWVWTGTEPTHTLPEPAPENQAHVVRLTPRRLGCHPHVMLGNGLDLTHMSPVHGFRLLSEPIIDLDPPNRVGAEIHGRFGPTPLRRMLRLAGKSARWRFHTIGPSLAWLEVLEPTPFELLWAGRPLGDGTAAAQTLLFLPNRRTIVRALSMMIATTWADRRVLSGFRFNDGYVPSDGLFRKYAQLVEEMPRWTMD